LGEEVGVERISLRAQQAGLNRIGFVTAPAASPAAVR
jgi:hypothetical protein